MKKERDTEFKKLTPYDKGNNKLNNIDNRDTTVNNVIPSPLIRDFTSYYPIRYVLNNHTQQKT
jgi:hypothetical protein